MAYRNLCMNVYVRRGERWFRFLQVSSSTFEKNSGRQLFVIFLQEKECTNTLVMHVYTCLFMLNSWNNYIDLITIVSNSNCRF